MKTESNVRKRGAAAAASEMHPWTKDFHSIDLGASTNKTQKSQEHSEYFSVHWILAPLLLSWGVWNCIMVPHVLNILAAISIGALILFSMVATPAPTSSTSDDRDMHNDPGNNMKFRINLLPSMNAWLSYLSRTSIDTRKPDEPPMLRLHRSTSTTSTFSSDSELEFAVRCSESTIAIDDDFDMYQDDVCDPEDDEVVWVAPDALNCWMVAPAAAKAPSQPLEPPVDSIITEEGPRERKDRSTPDVPVATKRKVREEPTSTSGRPVSTKRLIVASPPRRLPKSSLCRSPDVRRMMEELERMQEESDALVVAAESVGLGSRCTMNERLRRMRRA
ncbi:hypothetical protein H310_10453 [Aphanomyces invadans]|uniref:Uncharacterized protein n=1 Tax=Aphanomyces invadans TaxID=157072 RepID=A0A024TQ64_9STRA|nr:hypothetical protein H310_10453 [Aphanomyces invadans]ETV96280.1 hypothetical protein H310_10453 [Aphanomyces invadans]|eukprot:XP_008875072.1 hypothetical protein H310_10453 [Aphanomyces invadans]